MSWYGRVCAGRLVAQHGPEGDAVLERLLASGTPAEHLTAALALAEGGSQEAFDVLKQGLLGERGGRSLHKAIAGTLGQHYADRVAEWLHAEADVTGDLATVLWTLAKAGAAEATPLIEELCRTGTPSVRAIALRIVAREKGVESLPALRRCLRDGRPRKVAQEAFRQTLRLGEAAEPAAREMLISEHWTERKAGVCLLRRWGRLTEEQAAVCRADPHVAVRHAGRWHPNVLSVAEWHPRWRRRVAGN